MKWGGTMCRVVPLVLLGAILLFAYVIWTYAPMPGELVLLQVRSNHSSVVRDTRAQVAGSAQAAADGLPSGTDRPSAVPAAGTGRP